MGGVVDGGIWVTTYQAQSNLTSTRGSHTWRGGADVQWAQRTSRDGAGNMGTFTYDNTYTRAADTTNVFPAQQIGLSLAAFILGMPTTVSIADNQGFDVRNNYFGTYAQDSWRVNERLTLNMGLRFEYQNGIKEQQDRAMLWFDPTAAVTIAAAAQAAYAANPLPNSRQPVQGPGRIGLRGHSGVRGSDVEARSAVDVALFPRLQAGTAERLQGRVWRLLRHPERPGLDAQPGRLQCHDKQPAQQRLRSDLRAGRSEERYPAAG